MLGFTLWLQPILSYCVQKGSSLCIYVSMHQVFLCCWTLHQQCFECGSIPPTFFMPLLVREDSEVKKKVQLSCTNAVGLCWNCHSPCNLMDMYLFTPLYLCFTVEIYFCLYPLHTQVHSTWHFVQIHELSFASSAFLCCCCFRASAKIPITVARFSLSDTKTHTHTQNQDCLQTSNGTVTQIQCRTCLLV